MTLVVEKGAIQNVQAAAQASWYVDPVAGDDTDTGASADHALKTLAAFFRRMSGQVASVAQTVYLLGDIDAEGVIVFQDAFPETLTIQGQRTVIATGTLTDVVAYNHTPGSIAIGTIEDANLVDQWSNSGPGGTSLIHKKIVLTDGPMAGCYAWLVRDDGGKVAVVSPWFNPSTWSEITPNLGDSYEIVDLTKILSLTISVAAAGWIPGALALSDIEFLGTTEVALLTGGGATMNGCSFGAQWPIAFGGGSTQWLGCLFKNGAGVENAYADFLFCAFAGNGLRHIAYNAEVSLGYCIAMDTGASPPRIRRNSGLGIVYPFGVIINGTVGSVLQIDAGCQAIITYADVPIWCYGATSGTAIKVEGGGQMVWPSGDANTVFDFGAVDNDFNIGGELKSIGDLGTIGYVNLIADVGTGVITGNGAKVVPA